MILKNHISQSIEEMETVDSSLVSRKSKINDKTFESLKKALDRRNNFEYWCRLLDGRAAALQCIEELQDPRAVSSDETVRFGNHSVPIHAARLIVTQSYLTLTWSIADNITEYFGKVFFIEKFAENKNYSVQLVKDLMGGNKGGNQEETNNAALVGRVIRDEYGWPISISYALRNHFVHDGALFVSGAEFFAHSSPRDWLSISSRVWQELINDISDRIQLCFKPGRELPSESNLLEILQYCEENMDEALLLIFKSTNDTLKRQVAIVNGTELE